MSHPAYNTPASVRGYNGKPTVHQTHSPKDGAAVLRQTMPEASKEDHAALAQAHKGEAAKHKAAHAETLNKAAQETFGRNFQPTDYKVSGIGSEQFSDAHKDKLRLHAHSASKHSKIADAHHAASGPVVKGGGSSPADNPTRGAALEVPGRRKTSQENWKASLPKTVTDVKTFSDGRVIAYKPADANKPASEYNQLIVGTYDPKTGEGFSPVWEKEDKKAGVKPLPRGGSFAGPTKADLGKDSAIIIHGSPRFIVKGRAK